MIEFDEEPGEFKGVERRWIFEYDNGRDPIILKDVPKNLMINGSRFRIWVSLKDYKALKDDYNKLLATGIDMAKILERCAHITSSAIPGLRVWEDYLNKFRDKPV